MKPSEMPEREFNAWVAKNVFDLTRNRAYEIPPDYLNSAVACLQMEEKVLKDVIGNRFHPFLTTMYVPEHNKFYAAFHHPSHGTVPRGEGSSPTEARARALADAWHAIREAAAEKGG